MQLEDIKWFSIPVRVDFARVKAKMCIKNLSRQGSSKLKRGSKERINGRRNRRALGQDDQTAKEE